MISSAAKGAIAFLALFLSALSAHPDERADRDAAVRAKAAGIVAAVITPEMSDFEKILLLHEYVTDRVTYGQLDGKTDAYNALIHDRADCVGFARGLHALFSEAGLDSSVVVRQKGHLWVQVKIRDGWFHVDPTWCALKSGWRQYGWFLLSDAQNVDPQKGIDHVLDSGEEHEAARRRFVFRDGDYVHSGPLRSEKKLRIMGTVSLPEGRTAPPGGIRGTVGGNRFSIPEGENAAFYIASIPRDGSAEPVLKVRLDADPAREYARESFAGPAGLVLGRQRARAFDLKSDDLTGVNFRLLPAEYSVAGALILPPGKPAAKGGLQASIELTAFRGRERIRYYDSVSIPEGRNSVSYRIDIAGEDVDLSFYVYYFSSSIEKAGYAKVGYWSTKGTVSDGKGKSFLKFGKEKLEGVDLRILR